MRAFLIYSINGKVKGTENVADGLNYEIKLFTSQGLHVLILYKSEKQPHIVLLKVNQKINYSNKSDLSLYELLKYNL